MRHLRIPSLSKVYVRIPVATLDDVGALVDPTANVVTIAFTAGEDTEPTAFNAATWETSENVQVEVGGSLVDTPYKARLLVGPGALVLADGEYTAWVKIAAGSEIPVLAAGRVIVS